MGIRSHLKMGPPTSMTASPVAELGVAEPSSSYRKVECEFGVKPAFCDERDGSQLFVAPAATPLIP